MSFAISKAAGLFFLSILEISKSSVFSVGSLSTSSLPVFIHD